MIDIFSEQKLPYFDLLLHTNAVFFLIFHDIAFIFVYEVP